MRHHHSVYLRNAYDMRAESGSWAGGGVGGRELRLEADYAGDVRGGRGGGGRLGETHLSNGPLSPDLSRLSSVRFLSSSLSVFLSLSLLSAPLSVSVSYLGPLCLLRTCLLHPSLSVNFPLCISPVFRPIRHPRSSKAIPGVLIPSSVCKHECNGSYVPGGGSCEYHGLSRSCHH